MGGLASAYAIGKSVSGAGVAQRAPSVPEGDPWAETPVFMPFSGGWRLIPFSATVACVVGYRLATYGRSEVGRDSLTRYPRRESAPAQLACPRCGEPMKLLTKAMHKKRLRPGREVERVGGPLEAKVWICRPCGIQRRAQEQ